MKVEILNGKNNTFQHKTEISKLGFWYIKDQKKEGKWTKDCSLEEIKKIKKFCKKHKLEYAVYEEGYTRSNNYRNEYFKVHKGLFNKFYQCVYCGKLCTKKNITIDHIIPVDKVIKGKKREKYKKALKRKGITNINDVKNLVASCKNCNLKKSTNTGAWTLRAKIGKHPMFWVILYLMIIIFLLFIIFNFQSILLFFKDLFLDWIQKIISFIPIG